MFFDDGKKNNSSLNKERELLLSVSENDEEAFGKLYRYYQAELKPLVWKYAGSGIEAEEILQETFLKVWLNRDKLPGIDNFRAWIFKVASREYLNALRKKLHYDKRLAAFSAMPGTDIPESPFELTRIREIKASIARAIVQLSPQRRTIYEMSRNQGLKIDEIAEKLSISPQTVKNVLLTVTRFIREYLMAEGHGPFLFILCFFTIL